MNEQEVIHLYENVATITQQMLSAAREGDWDRLAALETRCSDQVSILKSGEPPVPLTGVVRERKVAIIKKILDDDREIRNLTQPWMEQLSRMINSTGTERRLNQAYGPN
ncbi:putative flagellar protein FliT [Herminiimonas arsenicoxydans]|uniref:Flagellar protein FliT n=1 Tax=Herminiimonas arsenicoxydans TaxID=204773 RepID=A4G684_HERAR|nr:putative flagellar protein FliT [Herminiimonas arsenicoxydans]